MKSTTVDYNKQVFDTKLPEGNFWDHSDGGYRRKCLPGLIIWEWISKGIVKLKCDINQDLANYPEYVHIELTLVTQGDGLPPQVIDKTPTNIELDPGKKYHLRVTATRKGEKPSQFINENWVIEFSPKE